MQKNVSSLTIAKRYQRVSDMQRTDRNRFKPNPRGEGYLTRNERYNELLWDMEAEIGERYPEHSGS